MSADRSPDLHQRSRAHIAADDSRAGRQTHNPKVAGSNPAPATKGRSGADGVTLPGVAVQVGGLPLTYDACRARFRRAAFEADVEVRSFAIGALGPHGQELTIDVVRLGEAAVSGYGQHLERALAALAEW